MRRNSVVVFGAGMFVAALVACTGGPGALPQSGSEDVPSRGSAGEDDRPADESGGSGDGRGSAPTLPQVISASEFKRDCKENNDCVAIVEGTVCSPCLCPAAAISSKDQSSYTSKLAERKAACPSPAGDVACQPCESTKVAACVSGRCELVEPSTNDGG